MFMSITPGWSKEKRFYKGANFQYNAMLAMREGHANALSFARKDGVKPRAHFAVIMDDSKQEGYFVYLHNGEAFKNADEIVLKGCTPGNSDRRGISLNGSGLPFMAATLEGELVVASKTLDEGKWRAGRTVFDQHKKQVIPQQAPDMEKALEGMFGKEMLEEFTVIYMWKVPYFEKKGDSEPWSVSDSLRNTLALMCGADWFQLVDLRVSNQICRLNGKDPLGKNLWYWKNHKIDEETGKISKGNIDHKNRETASPEEIMLRHAVGTWSSDTSEFTFKTNTTEDTVTARVTIVAFQGRRKHPRGPGAKDGFQFYLTERDSTQEFTDRVGVSWTAGKQSAEGARPLFSGFITFPLFYNEKETDEVIKRAFTRFQDNTMYTLGDIRGALEEMDIYYDGDKGEKDRNYVDPSCEPYAILKVEITSLVKRVDRYTEEVYEKPSTNEYMDAIDRNPLFMSGLPENIASNMVKAACAAVAPVFKKDHPDCYEWFGKNFKLDIADVLPIEAFTMRTKGPKKIPYTCYDLENSKDKFEFDEEMKTKTTRYLIVKDNATGNFVKSLDTTKKMPRCEGFKIEPISDGDFTFETKSGLAESYAAFKKEHGITEEVDVYKISVCPRGLKDAGGLKIFTGTESEIQEQYKEAYTNSDQHFLVPTRGLFIATEYGHVARVAVVTDVPKRPASESTPKPKPEVAPAGKKTSLQLFDRVHEKKPVRIGKGGVMIINLNFPMFAKAYTGMPKNPQTLKLGQALYDTVSCVGNAIWQTIQSGDCRFELERNKPEWIEGEKSIWENDTDYAVNHALIKALNVLPNVADLLEKLENHKAGVTA